MAVTAAASRGGRGGGIFRPSSTTFMATAPASNNDNARDAVNDTLLSTTAASSSVTVITTTPTTATTTTRRQAWQQSLLALASAVATTTTTIMTTTPSAAYAAYLDPSLLEITDRVYLDIEIPSYTTSGQKTTVPAYAGRLEIGLFGTTMPRATQTFRQWCADNVYAGTTFYRVLSDFSVQAGDVSATTNRRMDDYMFEPDNFSIRHTTPGLVSFSRPLGADTRFFITTAAESDAEKAAAGWADDRYAAFGVVLEDGLDAIVRQHVERVPVKRPQNKPVVDIRIVRSGVVVGENSGGSIARPSSS